MTTRPQSAPQAAPQVLAADRTGVAEIMTRDVITVRPDLSLERLIELFLGQGISRAPVVDEDGHPIGVVSKTDLVIAQYERGDTEVSQTGAEQPGQHVHELGGVVRDVMTPIVFAISETTSVGEAARRMLADNVHAVPVTSAKNQVIGILSATDVLAWVAGAQFPQVAPAPAR